MHHEGELAGVERVGLQATELPRAEVHQELEAGGAGVDHVRVVVGGPERIKTKPTETLCFI